MAGLLLSHTMLVMGEYSLVRHSELAFSISGHGFAQHDRVGSRLHWAQLCGQTANVHWVGLWRLGSMKLDQTSGMHPCPKLRLSFWLENDRMTLLLGSFLRCSGKWCVRCETKFFGVLERNFRSHRVALSGELVWLGSHKNAEPALAFFERHKYLLFLGFQKAGGWGLEGPASLFFFFFSSELQALTMSAKGWEGCLEVWAGNRCGYDAVCHLLDCCPVWLGLTIAVCNHLRG